MKLTIAMLALAAASTLSSRGRGPGEYLGVSGLYIDEAGGARETADHILFDLWDGALFSDERKN